VRWRTGRNNLKQKPAKEVKSWRLKQAGESILYITSVINKIKMPVRIYILITERDVGDGT
jgi:hypothetical protein